MGQLTQRKTFLPFHFPFKIRKIWKAVREVWTWVTRICINATFIAAVLTVDFLLHWFATWWNLLKNIYYTEKNLNILQLERQKISTLGYCYGSLWNSAMEASARDKHPAACLRCRQLCWIPREQSSKPVPLILPAGVPCCLLLRLLFTICLEFGAHL